MSSMYSNDCPALIYYILYVDSRFCICIDNHVLNIYEKSNLYKEKTFLNTENNVISNRIICVMSLMYSDDCPTMIYYILYVDSRFCG
jgi:hypothetical protein